MSGMRTALGVGVAIWLSCGATAAVDAGGHHAIPRMAPPPPAVHHHVGAIHGGGGHHVGGVGGWSGGYRGGVHPGWGATVVRPYCYGGPYRWGLAGCGVGYYPGYCYTSPWLYPLGFYGWSGYYSTTLLNIQPLVLPPLVVNRPVAADLLNGDQPAAAGAAGDVDNAPLRLEDIVNLGRRPRESEPRSTVRASSLEARRRSSRATDQGDELFARGRYLEALQKYKSAASFASELAQPYFRQGFAYLASQKYDQAAAMFRRGLSLEPGYVDAGFRLTTLYGRNEVEKTEHLEQLAQAALDQPGDADLLFLVGVFLHYDGEGERAARFFARASELTPRSQREAVALFLPEQPLRLPAARTAVR